MRRLLIPVAAILVLAACDDAEPPAEGEFAEQEVLDRTIDDEMLPYATINAGDPEDAGEDEGEGETVNEDDTIDARQDEPEANSPDDDEAE